MINLPKSLAKGHSYQRVKDSIFKTLLKTKIDVTIFFPAGTHWAVEIANLVLADGNMDNIDRKKQPHPIEFDFGQPGTLRDPGIPEHLLIPKYVTCRDWPSPRVFMTHLPEALMPRQICEEGKGKVCIVPDIHSQ